MVEIVNTEYSYKVQTLAAHCYTTTLTTCSHPNFGQKKKFRPLLLILQGLGCPHPGYSQGGTWTAPKPCMSKTLVKIFFSKENPSLQPPGIEPATSRELPIKESRYLLLSHLDWFNRDDIIWSIYIMYNRKKSLTHPRFEPATF